MIRIGLRNLTVRSYISLRYRVQYKVRDEVVPSWKRTQKLAFGACPAIFPCQIQERVMNHEENTMIHEGEAYNL